MVGHYFNRLKKISKCTIAVAILGLSTSTFANKWTNFKSCGTNPNYCIVFLDQAAQNYNLSAEAYNVAQEKLEDAKRSNTCTNLAASFNSFATSFGGFGAAVSHGDLAIQTCEGKNKKNARQNLEMIVNAYKQAATATYLVSGLHYNSCRSLTIDDTVNINEEIFKIIDEVQDLDLLQ